MASTQLWPRASPALINQPFLRSPHTFLSSVCPARGKKESITKNHKNSKNRQTFSKSSLLSLSLHILLISSSLFTMSARLRRNAVDFSAGLAALAHHQASPLAAFLADFLGRPASPLAAPSRARRHAIDMTALRSAADDHGLALPAWVHEAPPASAAAAAVQVQSTPDSLPDTSASSSGSVPARQWHYVEALLGAAAPAVEAGAARPRCTTGTSRSLTPEDFVRNRRHAIDYSAMDDLSQELQNALRALRG